MAGQWLDEAVSAALESDADVGLASSSKDAAAHGLETDDDVGLGAKSAISGPSNFTPDTSVSGAVKSGLAHSIPFATDIGAGIQAAETYAPWLSKVSGDDLGQTDPNATLSERFQQQKARINAQDAAVQEAHPYISTAASLAGGMAALPVAGPIERVSSAIGRVVPGLAGSTADILASGAVGAGYGAAYGAGDSSAQGGDIVSGAGYGALAGGIGGAAAPMLAEGISNAAGSAGRAIQGVFAPEAAGRAKAIAQIASDQAKGASMLSPEEINAAASAGQPVIAGDLGGKGTQVLARKVANENPDASQILTDPAASRFANQNTRLAEFVDNLYGGNVNPDKMKADLKNLGKTYLSPLYDKAMQEGADGIWTPTLQDLTATDPMQTAIKGATSIGKTQAVLKGNQVVPNPFAPLPDGSLALRDPNVTPSLEFWDVVQKSLKDQITSLRGKPFEQSNVIGVRNALLEQMDAAAPTYKLARQGAYEKFNAEDALEAGQNILKTSATPNEISALAARSPNEQKALSYGAASAVATKALNSPDNRDVVNLFNTPAMRDKLQAAMGPDKANQLEAYFRVETAMNVFKNAVSGNSTTAQQARALLGTAWEHTVGSPLVAPFIGAYEGYKEEGFNPEHIATRAAQAFGLALVSKRVGSRNAAMQESIARTLASPDPKVRAAVVQRIARSQQLMGALRQISNRTVGAAALEAPRMTTSQQQPMTPALLSP